MPYTIISGTKYIYYNFIMCFYMFLNSFIGIYDDVIVSFYLKATDTFTDIDKEYYKNLKRNRFIKFVEFLTYDNVKSLYIDNDNECYLDYEEEDDDEEDNEEDDDEEDDYEEDDYEEEDDKDTFNFDKNNIISFSVDNVTNGTNGTNGTTRLDSVDTKPGDEIDNNNATTFMFDEEFLNTDKDYNDTIEFLYKTSKKQKLK